MSPTDKRNENILVESKTMLDHSKPFEFYAVLQKYDTPNRNGRIYPRRILEREANNYKKLIDKGTALSELNHPESSLIDLDRVSHSITEIWWEGSTLMGKIKLLTSPGFHERGIVSTKGDMAANYLRQGVTLGKSSRGVGSLKKVGDRNEVQDDFELICFDMVEEPGHPLLAAFGGSGLRLADEIFQFREPYSRQRVRVLLSLDTATTNMTVPWIERKYGDFALAWVRSYGKGRVFYSALGHCAQEFIDRPGPPASYGLDQPRAEIVLRVKDLDGKVREVTVQVGAEDKDKKLAVFRNPRLSYLLRVSSAFLGDIPKSAKDWEKPRKGRDAQRP